MASHTIPALSPAEVIRSPLAEVMRPPLRCGFAKTASCRVFGTGRIEFFHAAAPGHGPRSAVNLPCAIPGAPTDQSDGADPAFYGRRFPLPGLASSRPLACNSISSPVWARIMMSATSPSKPGSCTERSSAASRSASSSPKRALAVRPWMSRIASRGSAPGRDARSVPRTASRSFSARSQCQPIPAPPQSPTAADSTPGSPPAPAPSRTRPAASGHPRPPSTCAPAPAASHLLAPDAAARRGQENGRGASHPATRRSQRWAARRGMQPARHDPHRPRRRRRCAAGPDGCWCDRSDCVVADMHGER